ncbi:MAG: chemotaxis response regulator protein-glutamate methylesterase [Nitrospirota bacterium]|nr:chemotaxis response regulator protein-glutamate methylesterase [Nitrospirota bacterium]
MPDRTIKILVTDDSFFMRNIITKMLGEVPEFTVIGTATDGVDLLQKLETLDPDVITLDIEMPKMDGLTALERLMTKKPTPVIILSSLAAEGAEATIRALQLGAMDFVLKPSGSISLDLAKVKEDLFQKIRAAAKASVTSLKKYTSPMAKAPEKGPVQPSLPAGGKPLADSNKVVLIGSSTGGPQALMQVIPKISASLSAAFLLVQHMPSGFTQSFAERLNASTALEVREAQHGDEIREGVMLLAPGDQHMVVAEEKGRKVVHINQEPRVWGVRPSVDVTINSAVHFFKERMVGVILTGMGYDGAKGISLIHKNGGKTIAQNEETCVVYGMPKAAVETGCVDKVLPLSDIGDAINLLARSKTS